MAEIKDILRAFIHANDLECNAEFRPGKAGRKVYTWFDDTIKTERQVRMTPEFQGFLDGHERHSNLYDNSGSLPEVRRQFIQELTETAEAAVAALGVHSGELDIQVRKALEDVVHLSPIERYNEQFKLGLLYSRKI